jgi:hypothetical protein
MIHSTPLPPSDQARLLMLTRGLTPRRIAQLFGGVSPDAVIRAAAGLPLLPATHVAIVYQIGCLEQHGAGPRRDL